MHVMRVFENRVLRMIFRPEGEGVIGGRRKVYSEKKLHNIYFLTTFILWFILRRYFRVSV